MSLSAFDAVTIINSSALAVFLFMAVMKNEEDQMEIEFRDIDRLGIEGVTKFLHSGNLTNAWIIHGLRCPDDLPKQEVERYFWITYRDVERICSDYDFEKIIATRGVGRYPEYCQYRPEKSRTGVSLIA